MLCYSKNDNDRLISLNKFVSDITENFCDPCSNSRDIPFDTSVRRPNTDKILIRRDHLPMTMTWSMFTVTSNGSHKRKTSGLQIVTVVQCVNPESYLIVS